MTGSVSPALDAARTALRRVHYATPRGAEWGGGARRPLAPSPAGEKGYPFPGVKAERQTSIGGHD